MVCGHCNCVAGLGEACSHRIAALLFTLDANSQVKKSMSCTSLPCYWLPSTFKTIPFARICDINFSAPQKKYIKLLDNKQVPSNASSSEVTSPVSASDVKPSESELINFYKALSETGTKPAILSIVPAFCEAYVPLQVKGDLPPH